MTTDLTFDAAKAAHRAHKAGLCVIPPKEDGSKRPAFPWKQYQTERPSDRDVLAWYDEGRTGVGTLCGAVAGNLEMFEFEGRAVADGLFDRWVAAVSDAGLDELLDRVLEGYQEHTPSGGVHLLWRCDEPIPGNLKIARDTDGTVLVETRGEGGFTILAPSAGSVHPTGKPWVLARGGFNTIPTITATERRALIDLAAAYDDYQPDEIAVPDPPPAPTPVDIIWDEVREQNATYAPAGGWMDPVIDDYCRRVSWSEVLVGWQEVHRHGEITYWRRPGKDDGHSATTNAKGTDRLIVFTSSVPQFTPWDGKSKATSYSKFDVYAALTHNGDRVNAARKLRATGYGPQLPAAASLAPPDAPRAADDAEDDETPFPDVFDLLAKPEEPYDWVVEHLIERCDRLIVTGGEGKGKSTLLRQVAVRIAAGMHPFTDDAITPVRVLVVDLENSERQIRRKVRPLVDLADPDLDRYMLFIVPRPQGLNLFDPQDFAWLHDQLEATKPDVLIIGPLYKMADGDPTEESHAKAVSSSLDALRVHHSCAVIIEAHSPHGTGKNRPLRPYGASLWLRWPEFGLGLTDGGQLLHWRGQRDERTWPAALERSKVYGEGWPWEPAADGAQKWAVVKDHLSTVDEWPSVRNLAVDIGIPRATLQRMIDANQREYDALRAQFDRDHR